MRPAEATRLALCAIAALSSCTSSHYTVTVRFDPASLAERATRVEVAIVSSCEAQSLGDVPSEALRRVEIVRMMEPEEIGALPAGSYGLYARAIDESCRVIAAGCEAIELT